MTKKDKILSLIALSIACFIITMELCYGNVESYDEKTKGVHNKVKACF
ncbi:MAG: hypothetical protein ACOWWH_09035 [Eubacteriaceae bacterium]